MLNVLSDVADAIKPAVVELVALYIEDVCRVSARVPLSVGTTLALEPVGSADRLKVIPSSLVLIVLLIAPGSLTVLVNDDCIGDHHVEFAPLPILEDGVTVSLAGTCVADTVDVRIFVLFIAASVTELNNENATVLRSAVLDPMLEMYTVEKVAVTMPDVKGLLYSVCVPFDIDDESEGAATVLVVASTPEETVLARPDSVGIEV